MNLQITSDLHLEHLQGIWPGERLIAHQAGTDALILAGDIANGWRAHQIFADWPAPVIYVAGNHEFYAHEMGSVRTRLHDAAARSHGQFHFLENESVTLGGVRFLGATLWTDYKLMPLLTQTRAMMNAKQSLSDHVLIRKGKDLFSPQHALSLHLESRAWLERELAKPFSGPTVVISHHAPHPFSVHPRFMNNPLNPAFSSDLTELVTGADLWVHGHTHDLSDYTVGKCRVVANPAGYTLNRRTAKVPSELNFENGKFNSGFVLKLDLSKN